MTRSWTTSKKLPTHFRRAINTRQPLFVFEGRSVAEPRGAVGPFRTHTGIVIMKADGMTVKCRRALRVK